MRIVFVLLLIVSIIPFDVVKADGCQPPSVENCPRPPGHEDDQPAPPIELPKADRMTRPPGHMDDVDAPPQPTPSNGDIVEVKVPEYLCYPFMVECWQ